MKSRGLIITGGTIGLVVLMLVGAMSGMGEIKKLVIKDVDLNGLADGVYRGAYHKKRWTYDVEVTVVSHRITAVSNTNPKTKQQKGFIARVSEAIIKKQSPDFDAVSGATISSKAFGKAVENALTANLKSGHP